MTAADDHNLTWEIGEVPVSGLFDDTFYSRNDGRAEAAYVFLDGNGLPGRFRSRDAFSIAELGFGTGLNFVETWRQWIEVRNAGQRLVFTTFERYPLTVEAMARALAAWPQLSPLAHVMLGQLSGGRDRSGRFCLDAQTELHLIEGDAEVQVMLWEGCADAWFLDGFSPARNPQMWGDQLMRDVFSKTAPGGSFATYTAAGFVRRNLEAAGFDVKRRPGHAGKREMLAGVKPL